MIEKREETIRKWFHMWLTKNSSVINEIFADSAVYTESWGPEYHGAEKIKLWFDEWNTRGSVMQWDIHQFFHKENQTVVQWYFRYQMCGEEANAFDGMSLITWDSDGRIISLQEFGCNAHRYDPYASGSQPQFEATETLWF
ncbi:nuclear transport factor 2 family protein [Massiliimalia massiliensis]